MSLGMQLKLCDFGNSCFVPEANQTLFDYAQDIEKYDESTCFKVVPPLVHINPGNPTYKDSQILHNGAARGTLPYTAPELIQNQSYSFQADIYSFGIVLYFLLSGLDPFARAKSNIYVIIGIRRGFFESGLQEYWDERFLSGEDVCPEIIHLIHTMLDLNPLNRPFANQIKGILDALK
jgi:serine/threonine protein kinase